MNTDNPFPQEDLVSQEDLALFALQLLPDDEARAMLEHLRQNAASRAECGALQGDLALYALGAEMTDPPAASRERLLLQISRETQQKREDSTAVSTPQLSARRHGAEPVAANLAGKVVAFTPRATGIGARNNFITWGGWAVAAGFALAVALQFHQHRQLQGELESAHAELSSLQTRAAASQSAVAALTDPAALNVSLQQPALPGAAVSTTPKGHAAYLPDRGALVFVATDLRPLKPYKVYELWLLPAEKGKAPIPAASFRPDSAGNAHVVLPTGPKLISVGGFGVTVEDGNSPPGKPTLPILLMGSSKT